MYNAFNVYCRELAPGTVSLTGDRAQGDESKHCAYSIWKTITGLGPISYYKVVIYLNIMQDNGAFVK